MIKQTFLRLSVIFGLILISFSSCDDKFEELNKSPDLVEEPNLDFLLPTIQLTLLDQAYYTHVTYVSQFVSHVSSYGAQFNSYTNPGAGGYHFEFMYSNTVKNLTSLLEYSGEEELVNYHSMGRIMKAYVFHSLTDLYGDVPYFEAGRGFADRNLSPKYDPQELIYEDMLNELKDAAESFDASRRLPGPSDIIYQGDINKWRKFAYSLILRLGLRMEKVSPDNARKWIDIAIAGGLMEGNEDNCVVYYEPNTYYATISNGQATTFVFYTTWKLGKAFVDALRDKNDPRIRIYSVLPNGDSTPENQKGLPAFTPSNEITDPLPSYSVSPPETFGHYDAPFIHLSYAQVQFMLAECVVKGWIDGDARELYEKGVHAAMTQLRVYDESAIVTEAEIDQYLLENPYAPTSVEEALELIGTQYWIETHYNWYETFSNWRRTGYPKLDETRYTLPRRLTYPTSEVNINGANVQAAIERQGPDEVNTRVWWDKE